MFFIFQNIEQYCFRCKRVERQYFMQWCLKVNFFIFHNKILSSTTSKTFARQKFKMENIFRNTKTYFEQHNFLIALFYFCFQNVFDLSKTFARQKFKIVFAKIFSETQKQMNNIIFLLHCYIFLFSKCFRFVFYFPQQNIFDNNMKNIYKKKLK